MIFDKFESSAIEHMTIDDRFFVVKFKSSDKRYKYSVKSKTFETDLNICINNKESIGRFISKSIKNKWIVEINTKESTNW